MILFLLFLVLLALIFGGFFVFTLKLAIVVAVILVVVGLLGGYHLNGRSRSDL